MTFDPTTNRVPTCLLTPDELAALKAAKHGWEFMDNNTDWRKTIYEVPSWSSYTVYRAKPAPRPVVMCNGLEVPAPVTETLKDGTRYWVAIPGEESFAEHFTWGGDQIDLLWLSRGLIYLTKADAVERAKAMLKIQMINP